MRRILSLLLILALLGAAYGYMQFNKGPISLANNKADIAITATDLFGDFQKDEKAFNGKYLNMVIEVSGKVSSIKEKDGIQTIALASDDMMFGVNCQMAPDAKTDGVKKGAQVSIKGQCDGALMDVVMTKCLIVNK